MESQIYQYIGKSKIIQVTHFFSTSLLRRNLVHREILHEKITGSTRSMAQADYGYLLKRQGDKCESPRINQHANTGTHHP